MVRPLLLGLFAVAAAHAQPVAPVTPGAAPEARRLLSYLYEIDDDHILSGQHNYNGDMGLYTNRAHELTGDVPVVWGTDFIWNGTRDPGQEIVDEAIRRHRAGHIVTLMWHAGPPTDVPPFGWSESIQSDLTDAEWDEMLTPGTPLHTRWLEQIDTVAGYLAQLRDAGVPVLWRPYHEMNGVWFWWGDKRGEAGFQKLWRAMFDRYANHHRLTNLLWVWNANGPRDLPQDQAYTYAWYYPGHAYVDVLATDVYHFDYEQKDYEELLALAEGRPIALGEVGRLPNPIMLEAQPQWAWFMVWSNWIDTANTPGEVRAVYEHPRTLSLGDVEID